MPESLVTILSHDMPITISLSLTFVHAILASSESLSWFIMHIVQLQLHGYSGFAPDVSICHAPLCRVVMYWP